MSTIDLLRAHAPSAPDELRTRVLAQAPAAPGRRPRARVRPVLLLAAALGVAIAAAVVQGVRSSGQPSVVRPLPPTVTTADSVGSGAAASAPTLKARVAAVPAASPNRLQHTDASIRVRVADADALGTATTQATRIATRLGGYAQSVVYRTPQGGGGASYIELRIPTARVRQALSQLAGLGTIVSQQLSIQDLTATLQRQSEQIAQLRQRVAIYAKALRDPSLPEAQRVLIQVRLADAKRALAQRVNGRKGTVAAAATSRVSLVVTTQKPAPAAAPHRSRLSRMLHEAAGFLAIEGMVVLFALIVASPFVLVLGLLWLVRRRAVDRLLME
jgi:hypothetical protein